jgi:hypothetical protein
VGANQHFLADFRMPEAIEVHLLTLGTVRLEKYPALACGWIRKAHVGTPFFACSMSYLPVSSPTPEEKNQ